ncbi:MAG: hypothetical protein K6B13_09100 [Prevotella sp.]|nr:hypothetical protein [Prevotella sp.]
MKEFKTVKRTYQRPAICVVSLQHRNRLLTASGDGMGKRDSYEATDENPFGGSSGSSRRNAWTDE